jgi:hypothetical protein
MVVVVVVVVDILKKGKNYFWNFIKIMVAVDILKKGKKKYFRNISSIKKNKRIKYKNERLWSQWSSETRKKEKKEI